MDRVFPQFYVAAKNAFSSSAPVSPHWRLQREGNEHHLIADVDGVSIDHRRLKAGESALIAHRSLIVDPNREAFVYLDRDDPALRTLDDLRRFTIARLVRGAEETRTQGLPSTFPENFPTLPGRIPLAPGTSIIGRDSNAEIVLNSPMVSRRHAQVNWDGAIATLGDLQSFNGTFRDGERLAKPTALAIGDRIDIGPYCLIFGGDHFVPALDGAAELTLNGVSFTVATDRGEKAIVRDVHLVIRPREFVAVIGSSGCGKSILTKLASGRLRPTSGGVYLDRESLHANFDAFRRRIAYVPQRDVLHESLTLDQSLDYAVRLRMPGDLTEAERKAEIDRTLSQVGLVEHRSTPVGRLSGGQTRRATLAMELLSRPKLLLLDEATTGLDEEIDGDLMGLFRQLADSGVTVICVTHHLGNIAKYCDRVAILTPAAANEGGGGLAFFGSPADALEHFQVTSLSEIYPKLRDVNAASWSRNFVSSEIYDRQIRQRTPLVLSNAARAPLGQRSLSKRVVSRVIHQSWLLLCRSTLVKRSQVSWIALMAAQAVGLAVILSWLFGNLGRAELTADEDASLRKVSSRVLSDFLSEKEARAIQAMIPAEKIAAKRQQAETQLRAQWVAQKKGSLTLRLTVSIVMCALWLGCNNASSEIVRERMIFEAEREVGLRSIAYLISKLFLLCAVVIAQSTILLLGVRLGAGYPGPLTLQLAMLWGTSVVGVAIGLAISAWSKSVEVSTALVPIAIIPQILFAGTLVPLSGVKQLLAEWLSPMHWSYRGMVHLLQFAPEDRELLGMVGALPDFPPSDGWRAAATLTIQGLIFLIAAWVGLMGMERFKIHTSKRG